MYVYSDGEHITSYGYNNVDMIEMLIREWNTEDKLFKEWFIKKLANNLGVEVRDKPLVFGSKEYNDIEKKELAKFEKELEANKMDAFDMLLGNKKKDEQTNEAKDESKDAFDMLLGNKKVEGRSNDAFDMLLNKKVEEKKVDEPKPEIKPMKKKKAKKKVGGKKK
jgi:hypothetical protein